MPPSPSASASASRHLRLWWRRRGRGGAIAATFAAALLAAALLLSLSYYASLPLAPASASGPRSSALVGLTLLRRAEEKGALCLDGSAPGYHLQRGSGAGSQSWLIHLEHDDLPDYLLPKIGMVFKEFEDARE